MSLVVLARGPGGKALGEPAAVVHPVEIGIRRVLAVKHMDELVGHDLPDVALGGRVLAGIRLPDARCQQVEPVADAGGHHPALAPRGLAPSSEDRVERRAGGEDLHYEGPGDGPPEERLQPLRAHLDHLTDRGGAAASEAGIWDVTPDRSRAARQGPMWRDA